MSLRALVNRVKQILPPSAGGGQFRHPVPLRPAENGRTTDYERVDPNEIGRAEEALRADPEDQELRYLLAFMLYASRQYNAAVKHFTVLQSNGYKPAQVHFHIGSCLYQLNHKTEARRQWTACLEAGPDQSIERLVRRRLQWFDVPDEKTPG